MVDIRRELLALLSPARCQFCDAPTGDLTLCAACRAGLPWNQPACPRCALPQTHDQPCARCLANPPPYVRAWAPFRLEAPIREQIHALKYAADFVPARTLGRLLALSLGARGGDAVDVVIPVPLHPGRLRRRGYNQSVELARPLADEAGLRVEAGWARRTRTTQDQIGMDAIARRRNVRGAFSVDASVRGLRVALLDDVMTTGATLGELARSCRRAGAATVEAWALARVA
ncbi:ComF family protein [Solimonas flava]|uniref:ComF family protein n=1 Tax=Solimonas flava TaxID=415849 RepID=UPI0004840312|nr:ComF family protein [Solimonas flava]